MNRIIYCSIICLLTSCIKDIDCSRTFKFGNKTNQTILLELIRSNPNDSIILGKTATDTIGKFTYKTSFANCKFVGYHQIHYYINDTSVLDYYGDEGYWAYLDSKEKQTHEDSLRYSSCSIDPNNEDSILKITVTDTLLTIFKKDYTMLENILLRDSAFSMDSVH